MSQKYLCQKAGQLLGESFKTKDDGGGNKEVGARVGKPRAWDEKGHSNSRNNQAEV